jgi:dolichol-phosphate mannosyltransferase
VTRLQRILVVIPTYNEKANLPTLVPAVLKQDKRIHVLVVDDASPDGTGKLAEQLKRQHKGRVNVMHRQGKLGLGTAYVAGFKWGLAKGYDVLVQMDADFSHAPDALPGFLRGLQETDVVVGTRYQGGRVSVVNWPLTRLALSMGASMYVRIVTGLPLSDCTGGFKAWRSEVLRAIDLDSVSSDGYSFQIEMNYKAWKKGYRIKEEPIIFIDRTQGTSKMSGSIIREAVFRVWALRLGF